MVWAFEQNCPTPAAKLVLIKLADHADDEGTCFPSQARVAADTGLARETVNRAIKALVGVGLLGAEQRIDHTGQHANRYFLRCDNSSLPCDERSQAPVTRDHTPCDERSHITPIEPSTSNLPPLTPRKRGRDSEQEFEVWWQEVPRKVGKDPARKKYAIARRTADAETLLVGIRRYAELRAGQDQQFTLHPASWLHQKRWLDGEAQPPPATQPRRPRTPAPVDLIDELYRDELPKSASLPGNAKDAAAGGLFVLH